MSPDNGCPDHDGDELPPLPPFLASLLGVKPKEAKTEHIAFLSKEEVASWNELEALGNELKSKLSILKAKRELFWAKLRLAYNVTDRSVSIDTKTSALTADAEE